MFISEKISKSMIPYIKVGNEFYFSVKAIDKWLVETGTLKVGHEKSIEQTGAFV